MIVVVSRHRYGQEVGGRHGADTADIMKQLTKHAYVVGVAGFNVDVFFFFCHVDVRLVTLLLYCPQREASTEAAAYHSCESGLLGIA